MNIIKHSEHFAKQLRKLGDKGTIDRLLKRIKELEKDPFIGEELSATPELIGLRSLQCGDWRVAYQVKEHDEENPDCTLILLVAFGHGHDVYDELPRYLKSTKKRMNV